MKTKIKIIITICFLLLGEIVFAQSTTSNNYELTIQPTPKKVVSLNKSIPLKSDKIISVKRVNNNEEQKAVNYFTHLLNEKFTSEISVTINSSKNLTITFDKVTNGFEEFNNQYYSITCGNNEIIIKYKSQLGLLFAVVTLSEYFEKNEDAIQINLFNVVDYPDFTRRIISGNPEPEEIFEFLDFALKNKMESIAIASRQYPWFEITDEYKSLFTKIKEWKDKFGGPSVMQMHNIYEEKEIEISNEKDINALKAVIKFSIENGADKLMILADDTPPFKYGEGYILTTKNDKKKFKHMAEAHCYLINDIKSWLKKNNLESELYYGPAFYTYEEMHYGEMELYKNTPWEDDAYKPFYRDLNFIGLNMPEDVFIVWCGPYVRSRTITTEDINDWTYNLKGVTPFLWDNTIYSHNPFISTPMFSAWDNNFPADFDKQTAGNGMFINGAANMEDSKVSSITVNDYMWNSKTYSPEVSLNKAMTNLYGENKNLVFELKETELELRKTIGGRELWFESDSLWKIIRKIRYIHDKNPFDYHFNYTRMKGLRLQLKNSVSEPGDKISFIDRCNDLFEKREEILNKLKTKMSEQAERLKKVLLPKPDFEKIK